MSLSLLDELDAALTSEIDDTSVGPDGAARAAEGEGDEDGTDESALAAKAEAEAERKYQERFNREVAALRSSYDTRLAALTDTLEDLKVDVSERDEYLAALERRYAEYDGDDAAKLKQMREQRKEALKDQGRDKRKLARLEALEAAATLASQRQQWLAQNVQRGAYPQEFLTHPKIQQAIANGDSDRDVMAVINGLLAAELQKTKGAAPATAARPKAEQTREREQARGKQPLATLGGGAAPQKVKTFADAEVNLDRELKKLGFA